MKTRLFIILATASAMTCFACSRPKQKIVAPAKEIEQVEVKVASPLDSLPISTGDSIMLSKQKLTSAVAVERAFPEDTLYFFAESVPAEATFYIPSDDIKDNKLTKIVQSRYNYAAVLNRVLHSYQWFNRMSTGADDFEHPTKKDTLEWIRHSQPRLNHSFVCHFIPDTTAKVQALRILDMYSHFDGDDRDGSIFNKAYHNYHIVYSWLPIFATKEMFAEYDKSFWEWYNKEQFVSSIDDIVRMNMKDYNGEDATEEQLLALSRVIACEKDIDRRAILALEYAKFEPFDGAVFLGDIIESGIYTRYLYEAWLSWRANIQADHSPSSFSTIPNNYYDMLRVKCIDTILRHCLKTGDPMAKCMLEELITTHILTRMACISGNESMLTRMNLAYSYFINPRLLNEKEN